MVVTVVVRRLRPAVVARVACFIVIVATAARAVTAAPRLAVVATVVVTIAIVAAVAMALRLAAVATAVPLRLPRLKQLPRLRPLRLLPLPAPDRNDLSHGLLFG